MAGIADTREAIERGCMFLADARVDAEHWCDFDGSADFISGSDEWVTAFVSAQLVTLPTQMARVARALRFLLRRQHEDGGWAFAGWFPSDCDSTAWALAALADLPEAAFARHRALAFVLEHRAKEGGFRTFRPSRATSGFRTGWSAPQPCVTAAAIVALSGHAPIRDVDLAVLDTIEPHDECSDWCAPIVVDRRRVFSTAWVVGTLARRSQRITLDCV